MSPVTGTQQSGADGRQPPNDPGYVAGSREPGKRLQPRAALLGVSDYRCAMADGHAPASSTVTAGRGHTARVRGDDR